MMRKSDPNLTAHSTFPIVISHRFFVINHHSNQLKVHLFDINTLIQSFSNLNIVLTSKWWLYMIKIVGCLQKFKLDFVLRNWWRQSKIAKYQHGSLAETWAMIGRKWIQNNLFNGIIQWRNVLCRRPGRKSWQPLPSGVGSREGRGAISNRLQAALGRGW